MSLPPITEWEVHITAQAPHVSEMTYTVSSGTLNPSIPYHKPSYGRRIEIESQL